MLFYIYINIYLKDPKIKKWQFKKSITITITIIIIIIIIIVITIIIAVVKIIM